MLHTCPLVQVTSSPIHIQTNPLTRMHTVAISGLNICARTEIASHSYTKSLTLEQHLSNKHYISEVELFHRQRWSLSVHDIFFIFDHITRGKYRIGSAAFECVRLNTNGGTGGTQILTTSVCSVGCHVTGNDLD